MIEPTVQFDILGEGRYKWLSSRHKPFQDSRFKGLGIITLRTRRSFTQLQDHKYVNLEVLKTYQFSDLNNVLLLAVCQTFQKTGIRV